MKLNGVEYYYIRNAQGDIIGLFYKSGTQVVSYTYDTWGKLISIDASLKDSVGVKNPYRYRGYRYDTETGLYYLQSRYYNPQWGRFINADGYLGTPGELLSFNMFAYCGNNPINNLDPSGKFFFVIPAIVAVVAVAVVAVVTFIAIQKAVSLIVDTVEENYNMWKLINQSSKVNSKASPPSSEKEITDAGKPGSKTWNNAKKKIKEGKGKSINVKARNQEEAEKLINDARPELEKRPTYEVDPPKSGYEVHPIDNEYNMPHIKWRDWSNGRANGANGHIFWDN